jgi:dipeptidyl aminopeptidase/acylaminoacyl peptidase
LFIGSSDSVSGEIVECDNQKGAPILRKKQAQHHPIPKEIKFETGDSLSEHAWYYPPSEKPSSPPPCIVKFHSGPTAVAHPGYSNESAIFTAMGYAIVYLNYRGSVTFGYDFQHMLHRSWGDVETEDADHLVEHLIANELADPKKMAVMGSSAGGYSLLHMLIKYPGRFNAAICSYAVSDLVDDAENTHKFERFYHRFLTGMYPEEKARFIDRSPLTHVDQISDPVALFHGADDPVVSPKQSELIFKNLKSRNVPAILKIYQDEGHGFHKKETLIDYYNSVFAFLGEHIN